VAVCMGTSVALGAAVGTAVVAVVVTAGAEAATGLVAVATGALADGAAPAADDVLGLQADSASPRLRPSAERPAILVARVKCRKFSIVSPYFPDGSGGARSHLTDTVLRVWA
jgi:hypothetical protein